MIQSSYILYSILPSQRSTYSETGQVGTSYPRSRIFRPWSRYITTLILIWRRNWMTILQDWSLMNLSYSTSLHICMPVFLYPMEHYIFRGFLTKRKKKKRKLSKYYVQNNIYIYVYCIYTSTSILRGKTLTREQVQATWYTYQNNATYVNFKIHWAKAVHYGSISPGC